MSEEIRSSFGGVPVEEQNEPTSRFGGVPTAATSQFIQTDSGVRLAITPKEFNATYQDTDETLYDEDLVNDVNFQKAAEVLYNMNESVDAERLGSQEDYAKYGIEAMGWFNWNLPKMTLDASRISGATQEQQKAFLYMMESYDDLGASWKGTGRLFKGMFFDPTTYIGLTTFGIGLGGKEAAKQASKQGIKELLKASTRGGIIAGVESGVYTAVDDVNRQVVETSVSGEDISVGRVVKSGAIGATAGLVLGTGITAGVNKLASRKVTKEVAESVDETKIIDDLPDVNDTPQISHEFSGNLDLLHGYSKSNREFENEAGEFISLGPLEKFDPIGEFKGFRFDGDGGTFGDQGVYLEDTSNLFFNTPDMVGFGASELAHVKANFKKAFVLTPDTVKVFNKLTKKGKGKDVVEHLKAQGYDGIIVKGFDPNKKYGVADEGFTQSQVMHFKPETMEVVSTASTKDRDTFVSGLPKNSEAQPTNFIEPHSTANRLRTSLDGVIQAIKRSVPAGKVAAVGTYGVQNMEELVASVEPIKQLLAEAAAESPAELAEYLKRVELTDGQGEFLEVATSQTVSALKVKVYNLRLKQQKLDGEEALAVQKQIDEIEEVAAPLDELDAALSTITGQRLRARQESLNTGEARGMTISSLMAEGLSRTEAERQFDAVFAEKLQKREVREVTAKFDAQIEEARKSGDTAEYLKLKHDKKVKLDEFKQEVIKEESFTGKGIYEAINKPIKVMNEVMISFVFSPATLIVNTVPSLAKAVYKPFLNNLMQDGLSRVSRKKMVAEYSAMASMVPSAAKMARAAWRYERSILTGDAARFLEEYNTIPKKFGGGVLRVFPRALLATDAFFENIHYRGYAVGDATGKAMEEGVAKGLKGNELDDFVEQQVKKAVDNAYAPEENAIDIIMSDGISRGLKGKKLENFVNKELAENPDVFKKATDQDGRDYVQDILFKRDFSGEGTASALAKGYEGFVNKHPAMRLMGQLFFRTPVRVFEEGIRMTPGLNMISPGFMRDLRGEKGPMRQARAQGEALMSYAIAGSVFSMYSTGNVTGQMGTDYKQSRQGENSGGMEPYSIRFSDGSTFNYRNFDPFSTPVKMIVNALERAETLAYRAEQGERINETEMEQLQAIVAVSVGSMAQSLRDANLASGVDSALKFFEDLQDPESSDQLLKFVGRKVQTFLPNTYYKMQMLDNPVLGDPVTMEHFIKQRVNPDDPLVPKQYTALGRPRTLSNPAAGLYYFNTATVEERKRGVPEKELEVEEFLYKLAQVGDTHFTAPYKMTKYMGDIDLRTQVTKDGQESYYDRWMRYTHESGLVDVLHSYRDLPMGTASEPGIAETETNKVIKQFREIAFMQLMGEEASIPQEYESVLTRKINAKTGQRSSDNIPFLNRN